MTALPSFVNSKTTPPAGAGRSFPPASAFSPTHSPTIVAGSFFGGSLAAGAPSARAEMMRKDGTMGDSGGGYPGFPRSSPQGPPPSTLAARPVRPDSFGGRDPGRGTSFGAVRPFSTGGDPGPPGLRAPGGRFPFRPGGAEHAIPFNRVP